MFSPIIRELNQRGLDYFVLHTGQHYSYNMDRKFFEDLGHEETQYKLDTVQGQVFITGNPIVEAVYQNLKIAGERSAILEEFGIKPGVYFVLTLHQERMLMPGRT